MRVTVKTAVTHLCPYVDERDLGTLEASWNGDIELHALAAFVLSFASQKITHEELTGTVAWWLKSGGANSVNVETSWSTAGLDVRCVDEIE